MTVDPSTIPTRRQAELLQFVYKLTAELGHEPRVSEINDALGTAPGLGITSVLIECEKKGLIEFAAEERRGRVRLARTTKEQRDALTERQREVLAEIGALKSKLGHGPSIAEINEALDMASRFGVLATLKELEEKGILDWTKESRRGPVRITKEGKKWAV